MPTRLERLQKRYEEANAKAVAARTELERVRREQDRKARIAERKTRTRRLIEIGGLAEIAEISQIDKGLLLGMFLAGKKALDNPETSARWKAQGDVLLAEREHQKNALQKAKPADTPADQATED